MKVALWEHMAVAVAVAGVVIVGLEIAPSCLDDAYIAFRYAANLAEGYGLRFNPDLSTPQVEGFSSPLWVLALSAVSKLAGRSAIRDTAIALGLCGAGGSLLLLRTLAVPFDASSATGKLARLLSVAAPVCWLTLLPAFTRYDSMGLEHAWFLVVVLGVTASVAKRVPLWVGVLCAASAPWIRPEGGFVAVAVMVQQLVQGRGSLTARLAPGAPWRLVLACASSQALLLAVRWSIFQEWVPNTYWAKAGGLTEGIEYVGAVVGGSYGLAVVVAAVAGALLGAREYLGYAAAGAAWLAAACVEGGDWMDEGRLVMHGMALLIAAAGGIFVARADKASVVAPGMARALAGVLLFCLGGSALFRASHRAVTAELRGYRLFGHEPMAQARWVKASGAASIALVDIGQMGFYTSCNVVDLAGLTDRVIAKSQGGHLSKHFDLRYIFDAPPDLVQLRLLSAPTDAMQADSSRLVEIVAPGVERWVLEDARFKRNYRLVYGQIPPVRRVPYDGRLVYARRGFRIAAAALQVRR